MSFCGFREVWAADFEFWAAPGERPVPICMVAQELISGRIIRLWVDELADHPCPFPTDSSSLFVAYYASAEMGCHLALGWPMPANVVDLYAEFRVETNGKVLPMGNGLLGALEYYGQSGISAMEKDSMRELVLRGGNYTDSERTAILDYCESDVSATARLFHVMSPIMDDSRRLGQALLRGRYTKAVARMEWDGIPIDFEMLKVFQAHWITLQHRLITRIDEHYGVYEGTTFKHDRFAEYLHRHDIQWPTTPTGRLALDDDTFSEQCKSFPALRPLKELRQALGKLRLTELAVGSDHHNRTLLSMFRSTTGRNQPSTTKFIFGLPAWLRGLIVPRKGFGLIYVDWAQQEFGIAAALSGDERMMNAYQSGDPYLAFAKQAGAVPLTATKNSHGFEREKFKACTLAVQYGMQEESLGKRIGLPSVYARELLNMHKRTYRQFWKWSDEVLDYALTTRKLWTVFGWKLHLSGNVNVRSVRNFPMQANGAEMLRLACCLATEAGIRVIAPVHDAVLVEAPLAEIDSVLVKMQDCMRAASRAVLDGFELRADAKTIVFPDRYLDERGIGMWNTVQELLDEIASELQAGKDVTC